MFIRFVSGEIDEWSHLAAGLFCAAAELRWSYSLPNYESEALDELRHWFNVHLRADALAKNYRHLDARIQELILAN